MSSKFCWRVLLIMFSKNGRGNKLIALRMAKSSLTVAKSSVRQVRIMWNIYTHAYDDSSLTCSRYMQWIPIVIGQRAALAWRLTHQSDSSNHRRSRWRGREMRGKKHDVVCLHTANVNVWWPHALSHRPAMAVQTQTMCSLRTATIKSWCMCTVTHTHTRHKMPT